MSREEDMKNARMRATAKFEFYVHAGIYVIVIGMLAGINLMSSPESYWFLWPAFFWGIGLVFHASNAFLVTQKDSLIDRMAERELNKGID